MTDPVRAPSGQALSATPTEPVPVSALSGNDPSRDDDYCEYELGERAALLQVRSFIIKHGLREVDAFCAQRLHDIKMDARR